MFDNLGDLPLHPLVIHAPVIGIPLAFLLAVLFAYPRTRHWARWPLAVTLVGATAVTLVAKESGEALQGVLRSQGMKPESASAQLISEHSRLADQLVVIMIVVAVLGLLSVFVVSARGSGNDDDHSAVPRVLALLLPILLVLATAVARGVDRPRRDLGARAVWNPSGERSFTR